MRAYRHRRFGDVGHELCVGRPIAEWRVAREQFVRHCAQRVEIGAMIGVRIAGALFGRHVGRAAKRRSHARERRVRRALARRRHRFGDAEVGHQRGATGKHHVVRLDVAMHHAAPVRVHERATDIGKHEQHVSDRHPLPTRHPIAQRSAFDKGHQVERQSVVGCASREERHDVGVLQCGGERDFASEAIGGHCLCQLGRKHFHHHISRELLIAGDENAAHATAAEFPAELNRVLELAIERYLQSVAERIGHGGMVSTHSGPRAPSWVYDVWRVTLRAHCALRATRRKPIRQPQR